MEEDFVVSAHETKININNVKTVIDRLELVKMKCNHCDCNINKDGFKIKRYVDGVFKNEFMISGTALLALVGQ